MGKKTIQLFVAVMLLICSCSGTMKDTDGNKFKALKFGSKIWMAENLNAGHFRNGDEIPLVRTPEEWIKAGTEGKPASCFLLDDPQNAARLGRLYNWYAINDPRGLAPAGWHIPSDEEWIALTDFLGGGVLAAVQMRVTGTGTEKPEPSFSGLANGARSANGSFYGISSFGYWWSSTELSHKTARMQLLDYKSCDIKMLVYSKATGLSVRLVRD